MVFHAVEKFNVICRDGWVTDKTGHFGVDHSAECYYTALQTG